MEKQILYLGDTDLKGAAGYLAGVMSHYGITFDYLPSDGPFASQLLDQDYRAVIISDYPSANFDGRQLKELAARVIGGAGLLMIGGWESFHGAAGEYTGSAIEEILPVRMQSSDDRVNCSQPCLVEVNHPHPIIEGLPFDSDSPGIGGYNRITAKPDSVQVLGSRRFNVRREAGGYIFSPASKMEPLLVVGSAGSGRVAAYASDVAPHWVGGLVDWGDGRVTARAQGADGIEVGDRYARFFSQMVRWTANL